MKSKSAKGVKTVKQFSNERSLTTILSCNVAYASGDMEGMEEEGLVALVLTPFTNNLATDLVNCNFVKTVKLLKLLNSRKLSKNCKKLQKTVSPLPKHATVGDKSLRPSKMQF